MRSLGLQQPLGGKSNWFGEPLGRSPPYLIHLGAITPSRCPQSRYTAASGPADSPEVGSARRVQRPADGPQHPATFANDRLQTPC